MLCAASDHQLSPVFTYYQKQEEKKRKRTLWAGDRRPHTIKELAHARPDRAPLKEVLGGQYNYREGGRQVLRQTAKGCRKRRKCQCSKDPYAQKVSGGRTDSRWKVHG